jgi:hypothetical protein
VSGVASVSTRNWDEVLGGAVRGPRRAVANVPASRFVSDEGLLRGGDEGWRWPALSGLGFVVLFGVAAALYGAVPGQTSGR